MQEEKETRIVMGEEPTKPVETLTLRPSPQVAQAASILLNQAGRVSRGRVKRAIRARREQKTPIILGGGARERARRLRQQAALVAKHAPPEEAEIDDNGSTT